jgi:hypothetical protein
MNRPLDPIKAWLSNFLLERYEFRGSVGPNGRPLYQYQVTASEYAALQELLRTHRKNFGHPTYGRSWASAFCLYVAERFRREYDGDSSKWSWEWGPLGEAVGVDFSVQNRRSRVVEEGLAYWKRPVRERDGGRNFLGSLFLEGGLPWPLVQSEHHGFGRVVLRGLKYHYRTLAGRMSAADLIAEVQDWLPQTFRTLETRNLLAGVVEQLMRLVRQHPLMDVADPAKYLDEADKDWKSSFPIPLDDVNARSLVNDWLRAATESDRASKENVARERTFGCTHRLAGEPGSGRLIAEITLPLEQRIVGQWKDLLSTRLVCAFYEGESLSHQGRPVYARIESGQLVVPYSVGHIALERRYPDEPLSLRLLESGRVVFSMPFEGSQLDWGEVPLVFAQRDNQWWLEAMASCQLGVDVALVRLPPGAELRDAVLVGRGTDREGGHWMEARDDFTLDVGDEQYRIRLKGERHHTQVPILSGETYLYASTPRTIFLGRPRWDLPAEAGIQRSEIEEWEDGRLVTGGVKIGRAGVIRYALKLRDGQTLLVRRFGLLPEGFRVQSYPALGRHPARLLLRNARNLQWQILGEGINATSQVQGEDVLIQLRCQGEETPTRLDLELSTQGERSVVQLHLAYPAVGVRLFDGENMLSAARDLMLDELLGARLVFSSSKPVGQEFQLVFQLQHREQVKIERTYKIKVAEEPVTVGLFGFLSDLRQMLGSVSDQFASVRLTVVTEGKELRRLDIGRYNGRLVSEFPMRFVMKDRSSQSYLQGGVVEAMSVGDPGLASVRLPELCLVAGVGTGMYGIPESLQSGGPWIVHPGGDSMVRFDPMLHVPSEVADAEVTTLSEAARQYHPDRNPSAFDEQITIMAEDLYHSGWQYLEDLRANFPHLSLSTFQAWKSLADNPKALAIAVLRLELNQEECERVREELAIHWESVQVVHWQHAFDAYRRWHKEVSFLSDAVIQSLVENRLKVLSETVPIFHLEVLRPYVANLGPAPSLPGLVLESVVEQMYPTLRRNHSEAEWPEDLQDQLTEWAVTRSDLPIKLRTLVNWEHARAVTYMPMYAAAITAGKASLLDLRGPPPYINFSIRKLADFDRDWYQGVYEFTLIYLLNVRD